MAHLLFINVVVLRSKLHHKVKVADAMVKPQYYCGRDVKFAMENIDQIEQDLQEAKQVNMGWWSAASLPPTLWLMGQGYESQDLLFLA